MIADIDATSQVDAPDSIHLACERLRKNFELTEREAAVMELIYRGRSKAYIAEELCISENTVRGHAKRVYRKLDVHSKDDLQRLIEET